MNESGTACNGLWISKLGDANAWYHIYPYASSPNTKILHIIRYKKPFHHVPKSIIYTYKEYGLIADFIRIFLMAKKIIKNNHIDYIVTFSLVSYGTIAWVLARLFKIPIIIGLVGTDFNTHIKKELYGGILLKMLRSADIVTIPGNIMRPYLEHKGINPTSIKIFPHCINDEWFNATIPDSKAYDLITIGYLVAGKRIQDIIKAVHILHVKGYKISLCILGEGNNRRILENEIANYNLKEEITMPGFQHNVMEYLVKSKIYVQASESEGLSLSLIEAMAVGLVPVATKAGSEEDIIENGKNGVLVNIGHPEEIAAAIESLCNHEIYEQYRKNVISTRERFSMRNAVYATRAIIEQLTTKKI